MGYARLRVIAWLDNPRGRSVRRRRNVAHGLQGQFFRERRDGRPYAAPGLSPGERGGPALLPRAASIGGSGNDGVAPVGRVEGALWWMTCLGSLVGS